MDDNLRTRAYRYAHGRIPFGDSFVFADLRAALVDDKGGLLRTLNGAIMAPGTDLYAMPDNVHVGKTIDDLLAVIADLEARLRALSDLPRYDIRNDGFTSSSDPIVERNSAYGDWIKAEDVLPFFTDDKANPPAPEGL